MSKRILYNITTSTSSSFQAQNVSSGTLNLSTGLTSASAQITNLNATTATVATLLNTNAVSTNVSSGTLNLSTGLTAASAQITNENVTTSTIATLRNTNAVSTNISSGSIVVSGNINANTLTNAGFDFVLGNGDQIGRGNSGQSRALVKFNGNNLFLNFDNDFSGGTNVFGKLTVNNGYNLSGPDDFNVTGTGRITTSLTTGALYSTNLTSTNVVATNLSSGTVSATTFTGGSLSLSGNLNVAGTLTTVNITSTNLVNTNVSAGVVVASTSLSATGSSNTIANIFTNSGNVGIGTTSPGECLDVRGNLRLGNSTQGNYIEFYGTSGDSSPYQHTFIGERIYSGEKSELLLFKGNDVASTPGPDRIRHLASNHVFDTYTSSLSGTFDAVGSGGTTRMLIDNNGNVGIGVSNPSLKLEVSGRGVMKNPGTGTSGALFFDDINKGIQYSGNNASVNSYFEGSFPTDGLAVFGFSDGALGTKKDGNRTCLMWTSSGNVGIGTTSPVGRLEVRDSTNFVGDDGGVLYITGGTNGNRRLHMGYANTANYGWIESVEKGVNLTNLSLQPRQGNVGIGTISPQFALDVNGIITSRNYVMVQSTATVASYYVNDNSILGWSFGLDTDTSFKIKGGQAGGNQFTNNALAPTRFTINTGGNVGIGTTAPTTKLEVNGTAKMGTSTIGALRVNSGSTYSMSFGYLNSSGAVGTASGSTSYSIYAEARVAATEYNAYSDVRIKKNIEDINDGSALTTLRQIQPKKYNYIDTITKSTTPVWGFLAQQVDSVLDYSVNKINEYVPNVYSKANVTENTGGSIITLQSGNTNVLDSTKSEDGKIKIKIHIDNDEIPYIETDVKAIISSTQLQIEYSLSSSVTEVFVYGQKVNDFHTLNKDAIFTVSVAALQEVDRELQALKTFIQSKFPGEYP